MIWVPLFDVHIVLSFSYGDGLKYVHTGLFLLYMYLACCGFAV